MHKHMKAADGKYHISGNVYDYLVGSRAQVWHGTAYKTSGGLKKNDIIMNKNGRVVSRKKQATAKREKRLEKHGYYAVKGKFGAVRRSPRRSSKRSSRRRPHTVGGRSRRR